MRTLQEKYNGIQEGKFSKDNFLADARKELPNLVTRFNGYDDAVQILKNKGMIREAYSTEESFKDYSDDALADMIINLSRFESNEEEIARVKAELERRKQAVKEEVDTESEFDVLRGGKIIARNVKFFPNGRDYKVGNKVDTLGPHDSTQPSTMGGVTDMINHIKTSGGLGEDYSRVLELPDGKYFAIDGDWEDTYQGNNGLFFTVQGNNIYDKDGQSIQSSPREFISQFTPEEILKVENVNEGKERSFTFNYNTDDDDIEYIQNILHDAGVDAIAEAGIDSEEMVVKALNAIELRRARKAIEAEGFEINGNVNEVTPAQEKYRVKPSAKPTQFKQDIAAAKKMIDAGKSEKEVVAKYGQAAFNAVNAQNLGEAKQPKATKKGLADYRYKPTNEMDKYPYEQILRGLRVELEGLGVNGTPTAEQYAKALAKVSKNLAKDPIFYTNQVAGVNPNVDLHDQMVDATAKNTVDTFNGMKKAALKEGFKKLIKKVLSEDAGIASRGVKYGQPDEKEYDFYSDPENYKDEKQQKPRFTYNDHGDFGDETEFGDEPEEREMFEMYGEDPLDESKVGDLYILAQESEGFEDFVQAVEREYGRAQDTVRDIEELEYIFNSARENDYDDENFSDSMIDGEDLYEVRKAKSLSELLK